MPDSPRISWLTARVPVARALAASLLSMGLLFLGFAVDRTDFWQVMLGFVTAFVGYFWLVRKQFGQSRVVVVTDQSRPERWLYLLIGLGILLRFVLIFAFPLLSDDIYRFLWDGYLINSGISPFNELPIYYLRADHTVFGLSQELFNHLNSPDYYTIYPPVAQGVFTFATALAGENWWLGAVLMKLFLFAGELGTLFLLWRMLPVWGVPRANLLLYWLNPLIIIEVCGNLHFEGLMVFFLLLALWWLSRKRIALGALAFALSVAAKLLPLMLLPFLIVRLWTNRNGRNFWLFSLVFGGGLTLLFLPLISAEFIQNFGSSLDLYFRKFEFNASIYYLFRAYGYYEIGWNQIERFGPLLGKLAGLTILLLAIIEGYLNYQSSKAKSGPETSSPDTYSTWLALPKWWLLAFTVYLLFATTVHPWYLGIPLVLSCFGHWRYAIIWSFFIVLTYVSYTTVPYQENYWLVGLEYLIVLIWAGWELVRFSSARYVPDESTE